MRARVASFGDPNRGLFLPVLGFPVRVHPSFWLVAVLAGLQGLTHVGVLLAWTAVIFLSVLAHELGHAFMASRWTVVHRISIHALGGETTWRPNAAIGWRQRLLIVLAGPVAGFALAFVGFLLSFVATGHWLAFLTTRYMMWVNVGWGIFNLLPIPPLDGGHALQEILEGSCLLVPTSTPRVSPSLFRSLRFSLRSGSTTGGQWRSYASTGFRMARS